MTDVHPTGVNRCGNIVGRVLRQNGTFVEGVLFSKAVPVFQCDGDPIAPSVRGDGRDLEGVRTFFEPDGRTEENARRPYLKNSYRCGR